MTEWQVTYVVDAEADTPEEAAKKVARMLTRNKGAAAKRAIYTVRQHRADTGGLQLKVHTVDLDRPERGGKNHFGDGEPGSCILDGTGDPDDCTTHRHVPRWPASEFAPCLDAGRHLLTQRHGGYECPVRES